jgi:predicted permease
VTLDLVGQMAIPPMLITLGLAISRLQPCSLDRALGLCLAKLAVCTAVPLAVGPMLGLPRTTLGVLVLQVATPVAATSHMPAAKYRARPNEVAGPVVVSTLLSVAAIPGNSRRFCLSFPLALQAVFGMLRITCGKTREQ